MRFFTSQIDTHPARLVFREGSGEHAPATIGELTDAAAQLVKQAESKDGKQLDATSLNRIEALRHLGQHIEREVVIGDTRAKWEALQAAILAGIQADGNFSETELAATKSALEAPIGETAADQLRQPLALPAWANEKDAEGAYLPATPEQKNGLEQKVGQAMKEVAPAGTGWIAELGAKFVDVKTMVSEKAVIGAEYGLDQTRLTDSIINLVAKNPKEFVAQHAGTLTTNLAAFHENFKDRKASAKTFFAARGLPDYKTNPDAVVRYFAFADTATDLSNFAAVEKARGATFELKEGTTESGSLKPDMTEVTAGMAEVSAALKEKDFEKGSKGIERIIGAFAIFFAELAQRYPAFAQYLPFGEVLIPRGLEKKAEKELQTIADLDKKAGLDPTDKQQKKIAAGKRARDYIDQLEKLDPKNPTVKKLNEQLAATGVDTKKAEAPAASTKPEKTPEELKQEQATKGNERLIKAMIIDADETSALVQTVADFREHDGWDAGELDAVREYLTKRVDFITEPNKSKLTLSLAEYIGSLTDDEWQQLAQHVHPPEEQ